MRQKGTARLASDGDIAHNQYRAAGVSRMNANLVLLSLQHHPPLPSFVHRQSRTSR